MIRLTEDKRMLEYALFDAYPNISCFTTTRLGGCSVGAYASFNCSPFCGDNEDAVRANQQFLRDALKHPVKEFLLPHQTHDTQVLCIDPDFLQLDDPDRLRKFEGVDALITNIPHCLIGVSTADCVPVLLYDTYHQAIGVAHAGWRGTVDGIVTKTLQSMQVQYGTLGKDVVAAIGPSISAQSFEVGEEVYQSFESRGYDMERISFFNSNTQKHHIDLWEANRMQLFKFGVPEAQIQCAGVCTYIQHDLFFSARRLGIASGRMLSAVMMNEPHK